MSDRVVGIGLLEWLFVETSGNKVHVHRCTQVVHGVHRLYTSIHSLYTRCTQVVHKVYRTGCTQVYTICTQGVNRLYTRCRQVVH